MTTTTVQFQATRYQRGCTGTPNPATSGHLNIDEGFSGDPPLPNSPGVTDYIYMNHSDDAFQPWKMNPLPDYVTEVTELCFQFYHKGAATPVPCVADFKLYQIGVPSVLLQTIRLNLTTSGNEAAQVTFDDFGTLSKAVVEEELALHIDMLPAGSGGGQDPPDWITD